MAGSSHILAEKYDISVEDLRYKIINTENKIRHDKIKSEAESNLDLVGKCFVKETKGKHMFPEMKKFYKVISHRSENEYRIECLCFYEHPTYWFDYKSSKVGRPGDFYLGEFEFESFETDSILAKDIRNLQEISIEEFTEAARNFTNEMLELPWFVDHYRWGNVMPTDEKWKISELEDIVKYEGEYKK